MDQVPFIEKHLKVCANSYGIKRELFYSQRIHQFHTPVLVSALTLRSRQLGQIDLCQLDEREGRLIIFEVKSSTVGLHVSFKQRQRLASSLLFLNMILRSQGSVRLLN